MDTLHEDLDVFLHMEVTDLEIRTLEISGKCARIVVLCMYFLTYLHYL